MLGPTSRSGSLPVSSFVFGNFDIIANRVQAATVSNWYAASSAQALGLSMWESLACSTGGQVLIAIVIVFNGRAGAKYHMYVPKIPGIGSIPNVFAVVSQFSTEHLSVSSVHGGQHSTEQ